jgi:sialate O-acetylesterase
MLKTLSAFFFMQASAKAEGFWLPAIISDHMVLQAGDGATLWGGDRPGQRLLIELDGQSVKARADKQGRWQARFKGLKPGGPHSLTIRGSEDRVIQDVLIGELWLGSGQSNMEWALKLSDGAEQALQGADLPGLRLFTVERTAAFAPAQDLQGRWVASTPETAKDFSAVAWHFGARLHQQLKAPVGLVVSAWGGTPAEAWTPRAAMQALPGPQALLAQWDADADRRDLWQQGQAFELELRGLSLLREDGSLEPLTHALQAAAWAHGHKPGSHGVVEADGTKVAYRGRMKGGAWGSASLPLKADRSPADLSGVKALRFEARGKGSFVASLSQASIKDYDYHAAPAFQLKPEWTALELPLSGLKQGGWGLPVAFEPQALLKVQFAPQVTFMPELAELAYNGMIAPLQPFAFKGMLWYQGESNAGRANDYPALLQAMVKAWRKGFERPALGVAVVQLPEFDDSDGWKALQQAQAQAVEGMKDAVLVPALGLGDPQDIHPRRKAELGERLFEAVLARFYPSGKAGD